MKNKSDVLPIVIKFHSLVEKFFYLPIKNFQANWGGGFQALTTYLSTNGISQRVSCPYTLEENGCTECKHRHIVEIG